jgi:hypothetical protein
MCVSCMQIIFLVGTIRNKSFLQVSGDSAFGHVFYVA